MLDIVVFSLSVFVGAERSLEKGEQGLGLEPFDFRSDLKSQFWQKKIR